MWCWYRLALACICTARPAVCQSCEGVTAERLWIISQLIYHISFSVLPHLYYAQCMSRFTFNNDVCSWDFHSVCLPFFTGVIKLQTCSKVTNRENMRGFKHVFDVCTSERTYHLVADSSQEKHDWINTLNTTLFTPSRAHKHSSPSPPQHSTAHDPSSQHHPVRYLSKENIMHVYYNTAFRYKRLQFLTSAVY